MNLLDRYCARGFIKNVIIIIASFLLLYLIIDFFEKIRMFISNQATVYQIMSFFSFSIPMILWQIMPAGILVASLVTFGSLSHDNEITAMKACGVSLYRTSAPIIFLAILFCLLSFLISEYLTPYTNERAKNIKLVEIQKKEAAGSFKQNRLWYRGKEGVYNFKAFDSRTDSLKGITIYYLDKKFNLIKRVDAERGEWENSRWKLYNAIKTNFSQEKFPELEALPTIAVDLHETPDNFKTVQKDAENMGYFELRKYVREIQSEGYDAASYLTDMQGKLAFPLVNVIMAIIGISFAIHWEKKGGKAWGIAAGIVIGLSYWLVFAFTISLGRAGTMPPLLAAWTANILFGLAAGILFFRIRT
jgi:lipopolysaccharide export system permease protein